MSRYRLSYLIVALCAACGSDFQASGSGGASGVAGGSDRAGSGQGDAGDTSAGGSGQGDAGETGDAGDPGAAGSGRAGSGSGGKTSTGGAGGTTSVGGSGGTIASGGSGGLVAVGGSAGGGGTDDTCTTLRADYTKLVDAARECTADDQCDPKTTLPAPTERGCPILVNTKANTEKAQAKYSQLEKAGCLKGIACPQVFCTTNTSASCKSASGSKVLVCVGSGIIKN